MRFAIALLTSPLYLGIACCSIGTCCFLFGLLQSGNKPPTWKHRKLIDVGTFGLLVGIALLVA